MRSPIYPRDIQTSPQMFESWDPQWRSFCRRSRRSQLNGKRGAQQDGTRRQPGQSTRGRAFATISHPATTACGCFKPRPTPSPLHSTRPRRELHVEYSLHTDADMVGSFAIAAMLILCNSKLKWSFEVWMGSARGASLWEKNLVFPEHGFELFFCCASPAKRQQQQKEVKHCRRGRGGRGHAAACRSLSQAVFTFAPFGSFCPGLPHNQQQRYPARWIGSMMPVRRLLARGQQQSSRACRAWTKPADPAERRTWQRERNRPDFVQAVALGGTWRGAREESRSWLSPRSVTEPLRCASNRSTAARGIVTLGWTKEKGKAAQLRRLQILRD